MEAQESTRKRLEAPLPKDHEDYIAGKGYTSMNHYIFGAQIYARRVRGIFLFFEPDDEKNQA